MRDLREWLEKVDQMGELQKVEGADWNIEIGNIAEVYQRKMGLPALLFDNIKGYPKGYRVLANSCTSISRIAYSFGLPRETSALDLIKWWKGKIKKLDRIPPKVVKDGPILENVQKGEDIDILSLPVPRWNSQDGGRYIGTGCCVILKDPDSDWVNFGAYRNEVFNKKDIASVQISPGRHGDIIMRKYLQRGEKCPIAISCGHDVLFYMISGIEIPCSISEFDICGGLAGEPVEVIEGPETGLPIPASAEIVIEGEINPGELIDEGPFCEWDGYSSPVRKKPIIHIKSILHRNDPIILGVMPTKPPNDNVYYSSFLRCAMIWDELESAGVPGVQGVGAPDAGGGRLVLVVSIKQMYGGHSRQAGLIASQCHAGAYSNRLVIVVDEDIDLYDINDVLWAICTRCDPKEDVEILKKCWGRQADSIAYPAGDRAFNSRMVIDACISWELRDTFSRRAGMTPQQKQAVIEKWKGKLPHLTD